MPYINYTDSDSIEDFLAYFRRFEGGVEDYTITTLALGISLEQLKDLRDSFIRTSADYCYPRYFEGIKGAIRKLEERIKNDKRS